MKRLLSILIITLLALCGCSTAPPAESSPGLTGDSVAAQSPEKDPAAPTVNFWLYEDFEGEHKSFLEPMWEEYAKEKNLDINLNVECIPSGSYHDKLITSISANAAGDMFKIYAQWTPELVAMDALADLTDHWDTWESAPETPDYILNMAYAAQDRLYGVPFEITVMYLYCRVDLFRDAGVEYPTTMEEFYKACEQLTRDTDGDGEADTFGFSLRGAKGGHDMWASMVFNAKEGTRYTDDQLVPNFNTPEIVEANQKYLDIYRNGWAPPTAPTDGFEQVVQNFKSGVTAMLCHHVGSHEGMLADVGEENVTVVPVPVGDGGRYVSSPVSLVTVSSKSENLEAALEVTGWLMTPPLHDKVTWEIQQIPWMSSIAEQEKYQSNPFFKVSIDSLADAYPVSASPLMGQFTENIWPQTIQRALLGEITSQEMIDILESALQR